MADPTTERAAKAKLALTVFGAIGLTIFFVVLIGSIRQDPGIGGVLKGIVIGLFTALIVPAGGTWFAMSLIADPPPPLDYATADVLQQALAPVLAELEKTRIDVVAHVNARLPLRLGVCGGGAVLFWLANQFSKDPPGALQLLEFTLFGGVLGYYWAAASKLGERYRCLYKQRVLPQLAARFGALSYRPASVPDLGLLTAEHVFAKYEDIVAEDEIFGTYRGLPLSIIELSLTSGLGDDKTVQFRGLLASVTLPRGLRGTTAIIADTGLFGGFRDWMAKNGRDRVHLEDPKFEALYDVYGTDQIAARALLTPAFMERFLALGARPGYQKPLALARDNALLIALPTLGQRNLFEPPSFNKPAASREALLSLNDDIAAVLIAADAVIDLDQAARSVAAEGR